MGTDDDPGSYWKTACLYCLWKARPSNFDPVFFCVSVCTFFVAVNAWNSDFFQVSGSGCVRASPGSPGSPSPASPRVVSEHPLGRCGWSPSPEEGSLLGLRCFSRTFLFFARFPWLLDDILCILEMVLWSSMGFRCGSILVEQIHFDVSYLDVS